MTPLLITLGLLLFLALWATLLYNALVRTRNHCNESWADVDTELKRRYDLIPNLVQTVRGYAAHERETLDRVVAARNTAKANEGPVESQARDENALIGSLRKLAVVVEAYPALKADAHFLELQEQLALTEDRIQRARRFFNANVRHMNNLVETVPSNLMARVAGFTRRAYFEIDEPQRQTPSAAVLP